MAEKKNILTYAGLKQYEDELQNLKVFRRKEVAQKIKEAREQGDLSENAEYDAAKRSLTHHTFEHHTSSDGNMDRLRVHDRSSFIIISV
jgi:hypothetical protein